MGLWNPSYKRVPRAYALGGFGRSPTFGAPIMATLVYDPSSGDFLNGGTVQAPATGDTVIFTDNGGVPYSFTVPAGFPSVAEIDITSADATVVVPGGQTLT